MRFPYLKPLWLLPIIPRMVATARSQRGKINRLWQLFNRRSDWANRHPVTLRKFKKRPVSHPIQPPALKRPPRAYLVLRFELAGLLRPPAPKVKRPLVVPGTVQPHSHR